MGMAQDALPRCGLAGRETTRDAQIDGDLGRGRAIGIVLRIRATCEAGLDLERLA